MKEPVQLCYTISEAAKVMEVEPHVLRYWEEELGLDISRNSMGHRIYTDDDLKTFRAIKQLKANHVALKYSTYYPMEIDEMRYQSASVFGLWYPEKKLR